MSEPLKFEKVGHAYIGYAIAIRSQSGAEFMIFCPSQDEAIMRAEQWGKIDINPAKVRRAVLGPEILVSQAASQVGAQEESKNG